MIRVIIPDETGHSEFQVATLNEVKKEVKERGLEDKWFFVDGNYTKDLKLNEVTEQGIKEIHLVDRLVGG